MPVAGKVKLPCINFAKLFPAHNFSYTERCRCRKRPDN